MKFLSRLDDFESIIVDGDVQSSGLSSLYIKDSVNAILRIGNTTGDSFITYDGSELSISSDLDLRLTTPTDQDVFLITSSGNIVTTQGGGTFTIGGGLTLENFGAGFLTTDASGVVSIDTNTYLTAEADTLDSVTNRGATTTNAITVGGLTADSGTLYVDTANNRVGIGTTNPFQKLQVEGSIYSNGGNLYVNGGKALIAVGDLAFQTNNGTSYAEVMRMTGGGNVGIGTTSPGAKLDVRGDVSLYASGQFSDPFTASWRSVFVGSNATIFARDAVNLTDFVISNNHYVENQSSSPVNVARTDGKAASIILVNDEVKFIYDSTSRSTGATRTFSESMRISGGKVGIGTTVPNDLLQIGDTLGGNASMSIASGGTSSSTLYFRRSTVYDAYIQVDANEDLIIGYNSADLGDNLKIVSNSTNVATFDSSGNLKLSAYGAGLLASDASGNITVDTTSYSTFSGDYDDLTNKPTIPVSGTDFDPVGTDNSTNVTLVTTSHDYLSISGQAITLDAINLDDINGGATAGYLKTDASGNITVDTSTIEDTLDSVTARSGTTSNTIQVGGITVAATFPYLDFVDTNSFTDGNDRFRVRAGSNEGLIQWYDDSASSLLSIMTFQPDGNVIVPNGNVGIGTTDPSVKLHVVGDITLEDSGTPIFRISDSGNGGGGGASGVIRFTNTGGSAIGIGYTNDDATTSDLLISTNAGSTYGGYLGLDSGAITDPSSIVLDPKTNVLVTNGNVGIGTTNPGAKLHVSSGHILLDNAYNLQWKDSGGTVRSQIWLDSSNRFLITAAGNGQHLHFGDGTSTTSDTWFATDTESNYTNLSLMLKADGRVGIGTADPSDGLTVATSLRAYGTITSPGNGAFLGRYSSGVSLDAGELVLSTNGKTGWDEDVDEFGRIRFYSSDGSGIGARDAAVIKAINGFGDGSTTTTFSGELAFFTSAYNANVAEVLRIDGNGNVGAGTSSPISRLHAVTSNGQGTPSNYAGNIATFQANNSTGYAAYISVLGGDTGRAGLLLGDKDAMNRGMVTYSNQNERLEFGAAGAFSHLVINSSGNVGINETSPLVPLHISRDSASGENVALLLDNNNTTAGNEIGMLFRTMVGSTNTDFEIFGKANAANDMDLVFQSDGSVERVRFTGDGKVGIGTDNPSRTLDVRGDAQILSTGATGLRIVGGTTDEVYMIFGDADDNSMGGFGYDNNANSLSIDVNNAERMRIHSSGSVVVGDTYVQPSGSSWTTSNSQFILGGSHNTGFNSGTEVKLLITGYDNDSSTIYPIYVEDENGLVDFWIKNRQGGTAAPTMYFAGNVGIGTTAPQSKLHLTGAITISDVGGTDDVTLIQFTESDNYDQFSIRGDFAGTGVENKLKFSTDLGGGDILTMKGNGNVGIGTNDPTEKLTVAGELYFPNISTTDGTNVISFSESTDKSFSFKAYYNGTGASGNKFGIGSNVSGWSSNIMTWQGDGNVGIGTTSPGAKLEVFGTGNTLRLDSAANGSKEILFRNVGTGTATIKTDGDLKLYVEDAGKNILFDTTGGEKMRITAAGNVGIGTASPATKLHVVGTAETRLRVGSSNASSNVVLELRDENSPTGQGTVITYNNATGETYFNNALSTATTDFHFQSGEYGSASDFFTLSNAGGNSIVQMSTSTGDAFITYEGATNEMAIASDGDLRLTTPTDQDVFFISSGGNIDMTQAGGNVDMGGNLTVDGNITGNGNAYITGDVGIGTNTPTSPLTLLAPRGDNAIRLLDGSYSSLTRALLYVSSSGHGALELSTGTNTGTVKITSSGSSYINGGNIGIGTTAPQQLLHIKGATSAYIMLEADSDTGTVGTYYKSEDTDDTMNRTKGFFGWQGQTAYGNGYFTMWLDTAEDNGAVTSSEEKFRWERDGDFHADGDVIAYSTTTPSDERLKDNIKTIENASEKIAKMRGVEYQWNTGKLTGKKEIGLIAQEVEAIVPEVVAKKKLPMLTGTDEVYKTVDYERLVALLIESNKELQNRITELESKVYGTSK